jgi:hypothetical protein
MSIVAVPPPLASAATVLFGRYGDVTRHASQRGVSRQTLYREADFVLQAVEGTAAQQRTQALQQRLAEHQDRVAQLRRRLAQAVVLDADRLAEFASTAQAEGVSLPLTRRLLQGLLGPAAPSVARLGRWTRAAGRRAGAALAVLDPASRALARQVAADEIFAGRRPILMTVEPDSLCWLGGRLASRRDATEWAQEFRQLPALEQVTRDGGTGMAKGLRQLNGERQAQGQPAVADQADHFHLLREGTRALRRLQAQTRRAVEEAAKAQKELGRWQWRGGKRTGRATVAGKRWRQAEAVMDRWVAAERAWRRLRQALRAFTPEGELNTRGRAEAAVAALLPELAGPEWAKVRRQLRRPEVFTFLDRAAAQLEALPVPAEVRAAAVRVEGLRRQPELLQGEGRGAAALRGVLLAAGLVLTLSGEAGQQAVAAVRGVLRRVWRASSPVEGVHSVLRMQQARHRRITQELLDLKRLYWNCREFRTGRRKGQTPYQRLGLTQAGRSWWEVLRLSPEQLQLSAAKQAA